MDYHSGAERLRPPDPSAVGMSTSEGTSDSAAATGACAAPAYVEPTHRGRHEWRMALRQARDAMVGKLRQVVAERYGRDDAALTNFQSTMQFARAENVVGLSIVGAFTSFVLPVMGPLANVMRAVVVSSDIYGKASAASQNVALGAWIDAHRRAIQSVRETSFDGAGATALAPLDAVIEDLVGDPSQDGERRKQELEAAMVRAEFPVEVTTLDLEMHLYEAWCRLHGARFVQELFEVSGDYPGQEEVGTTDQAHPAFRGRQITGVHVPPQILDTLARLGIDPMRMSLPVDSRHHRRRAPDNGTPHWEDGDVTHFEPRTTR
ncbi:MAG: hypothetical protein U1F43_12030 [Myxococcota bacterium]